MIAHSPQRSVGSTDQTKIWSLNLFADELFQRPMFDLQIVIQLPSANSFVSGAQLYLRPKIDLLTAKTRAEPIIAEAINGCDGGWSEKLRQRQVHCQYAVHFIEVW